MTCYHFLCQQHLFSLRIRPIMAGGHVKYRHLSRDSAHRRALLRNLVTSLLEHESISTSWHKAKEAQRMAEKMISLAKRNTMASRKKAQSFLFVCPQSNVKLPKYSC